MDATVVTTTREAWEKMLAAYPSPAIDEHRREETRYESDLGNAALAFESESRPVLLRGRVLNAASNGVLLRLRERIRPATEVLLRLTLVQGEATLVGQVVHCTPTVGAYKVGIQLLFDAPAE